MSKTKSKPKTRPYKPKFTDNPIEAEATKAGLVFEFRGAEFVIDYATADLPRALFAFRMAFRSEDIQAGMEFMLDSLEATLGADQIVTLYRVCPDFFSSEEVASEFWAAWVKAMTESTPGEF